MKKYGNIKYNPFFKFLFFLKKISLKSDKISYFVNKPKEVLRQFVNKCSSQVQAIAISESVNLKAMGCQLHYLQR